MGLSQRNCALLLVFVAVVWIELSQAHPTWLIGRCQCPRFSRGINFSNITDFKVIEKWAGCDKTEIILTRIQPDNNTKEMCMNPSLKIGLSLSSCWKRINKDESRKMECIEGLKRPEKKTSED
uniref:Chemokine interleukin-8-like domain-containing protein n=1 Tax=Cyprinodon variegatus TaxID=28743 RepID=A0A3Q2CUX7_CYPVA